MSGRHRFAGPLARQRRPLVLAVAAGLVGVTAVTIGIVGVSTAGCTGRIPLDVAAAPELAPALREIGAAWSATSPEVDGACVELAIEPVISAVLASRLTVYAGRAIDTGAAPEPTPREETLPAVWIPDSSAWVNRVSEVDRAMFAEDPQSLVSTPVVLATPEDLARQIGWPSPLPVSSILTLLESGSLRVGVADPRRETPSLAAAMLISASLSAADEDLPRLVRTLRGLVKTPSTVDLLAAIATTIDAGPASEHDVLAHNLGDPATPLVAVGLDPPQAQLDYPYAIRTALPRRVSRAAELFLTHLLRDDARGFFARDGFRDPDGIAGEGFPRSTAADNDPVGGAPIDDIDEVTRALALWSAANSPSRTLALFDVTSSMEKPMVSGGESRASVMIQAARSGLELFQTDSRVGMWAFGPQHQEVLPIEDLTPASRAELEQRMGSARPGNSDRCELYATLIDAYQTILDGYVPGRPNIIVVLTDGADSDTSALALERFNLEMQRLADPVRPVRVVLIGIGADPDDAEKLQAVAEIVGGGYFPLTSPDQIQTIFLRALLRISS